MHQPTGFDLKRGKAARLPLNRLALIIISWWCVVLVAYAIAAVRTERLKEQVKQAGVNIAGDFSGRASLPLLERDIQGLRALLAEVTRSDHVVYASIVDHKNKIIAYTDPDLIMTMKGPDATISDQVSFWESKTTNDENIISFSSDVNFAETKIGEIFVALADNETNRAQRGFVWIAVGSLIAVLLVVLFFYYEFLLAAPKKIKESYLSRNDPIDSHGIHPSLRCPLCGANQNVSAGTFGKLRTERRSRIRVIGDNPGSGDRKRLQAIRLADLAKRQDLGWLRRQIIQRCSEIIQRLAA